MVEPATSRPVTASVADGDPMLAQLGQVWSELFGLASVAPDDDFFALGGNSLQAVQMFQHARDLEFEQAAKVRDEIGRLRALSLG